jgi:hypothetical protein
LVGPIAFELVASKHIVAAAKMLTTWVRSRGREREGRESLVSHNPFDGMSSSDLKPPTWPHLIKVHYLLTASS